MIETKPATRRMPRSARLGVELGELTRQIKQSRALVAEARRLTSELMVQAAASKTRVKGLGQARVPSPDTELSQPYQRGFRFGIRSGQFCWRLPQSGRKEFMQCRRCGTSQSVQKFGGEVALHFPGRDGLNKPIVWVFPQILACLDCGIAEFEVPEEQLKTLRNPQSSGQAGMGVAV